jgi:hypothetical protein
MRLLAILFLMTCAGCSWICPECPNLGKTKSTYECVGSANMALMFTERKIFVRKWIIAYCECKYDEEQKAKKAEKRYALSDKELDYKKIRDFCTKKVDKELGD